MTGRQQRQEAPSPWSSKTTGPSPVACQRTPEAPRVKSRPLPLLWLAVLEARLTQVGRLVIHDRFSGSAGKGVNLILIPGLGLSGRYMLPAARLFSRDMNVLVPDLPGAGRSSASGILSTEELADVLGEWLDAVGVTRAVVLGNSYGAAVAVACALQRADRVVGTVLAGRQVIRTLLQQSIRAEARARPTPRTTLAMGRRRRRLRALRPCPSDAFPARADQVSVRACARGYDAADSRLTRACRPDRSSGMVEAGRTLLAKGERAEVPGGHAAHYTHPAQFTTTVRRFLGARGFIDSGAQP